MRLHYIDESEGPRYYVRPAPGVDAERWNDLHQRVLDLRLGLRECHAFLIFDEGREEMVTCLDHRLRSRNPVPQQVRGLGGRRAD